MDTVFFGGGTPSLFSPDQIGSLLEALRRNFDFAEDPEVSIEANPGTLSNERLKGYLACGVNRISIGVESLDDEVLAVMGRIHNSRQAEESVLMAKAAGFRNVSCDLMFAVPGQTRESWLDTLRRTIRLSPEHISFYSLQIEEGTPFYEDYRSEKLTLLDDEEDRMMYHEAAECLKNAGYRHYEISNACLPGKECQHNMKYWSFSDYLGIGSSASSFVEGIRFTEAPLWECHKNNLMDSAGEFVFTGLRKCDGITYRAFREKIGKELWDVFGSRRGELEEFFSLGELEETKDGLRLTEKGIDISNRIFAVFV